ncbi:MAG: hypothetical protein HY868_00700 [Chloroflexi bacterium]|nr:hypothetical protein [Chloroflexota bacterium]
MNELGSLAILIAFVLAMYAAFAALVGGDGLTIVVVNSQGQVFRSNDRGVTWSGK